MVFRYSQTATRLRMRTDLSLFWDKVGSMWDKDGGQEFATTAVVIKHHAGVEPSFCSKGVGGEGGGGGGGGLQEWWIPGLVFKYLLESPALDVN